MTFLIATKMSMVCPHGHTTVVDGYYVDTVNGAVFLPDDGYCRHQDCNRLAFVMGQDEPFELPAVRLGEDGKWVRADQAGTAS